MDLIEFNTLTVGINPTEETNKFDNENNDENITYRLLGKANLITSFLIINLAIKCVGLKNGNKIIKQSIKILYIKQLII